MRLQKYYRNKYMIGIYGPVKDGEQLLGLCDTVKEFAEFMKIKETNARMILQHMFYRKNNYLKLNGQLCTVEFIEVA